MTAVDVDIAVVGAGVVGCAVAREFAGYDVSVALIDARDDVGDATSKANTAILHTGFDAVPGSLEATLVARGYALLGDYAEAAGIPVERIGAVLVAWSDDELAALPGLRDKAVKNGYLRCEIVGPDDVYAMLPHLGEGVLGGLTVPDESIICPWTTTLAYATEALARGTVLLLGYRVTGVTVGADATTLATTRGDVRARWVVNAAGLGADVLDRLLGHDRFTVVPRRGELLVFDKLARPMADRIVLPVPTAKGKGVLVSPTIYGNVMLGPTSENLTDRADTSTIAGGLRVPALQGTRDHAGPSRRGGHRELRGPARGHRAQRLRHRRGRPAAVRAARRDQVDGTDRLPRHRRACPGAAGRERSRPDAPGGPAGTAADAEHRRGVPASLPACGADRRRP